MKTPARGMRKNFSSNVTLQINQSNVIVSLTVCDLGHRQSILNSMNGLAMLALIPHHGRTSHLFGRMPNLCGKGSAHAEGCPRRVEPSDLSCLPRSNGTTDCSQRNCGLGVLASVHLVKAYPDWAEAPFCWFKTSSFCPRLFPSLKRNTVAENRREAIRIQQQY